MTEVAAIYFPSWHADARRDREFGREWTEWELVKAGIPRFDGHYQPIEPAWGYADETDPSNMQRSCDLAQSAGIDAFLWDWYWYDDAEADYLNRPLDETYLALESPAVKFALMWANHDWADVFPARTGVVPRVMYPGAVSPAAFHRMTEIVIDRYFSSDQYWRVNGAAWFTIYRLDVLVDGLGGLDVTRELLEGFRDRARAAGVGEVHLNVLDGWQAMTAGALAELTLDSVGHYNWASVLDTTSGLEVSYPGWRGRAVEQWARDHDRLVIATGGELRYVPNVTMGWDSTARVSPEDELIISEWPHLPVVTGNTPEEFAASCRAAKQFADETGESVIVVNAWNEWTEGSYLEPDSRYGLGYIDAMAKVFSP